MKDNKELEALYRDFIENSGFSCVECDNSNSMTLEKPYCKLAPELEEMQRNTTTVGDKCPYKLLFKQALTKEVDTPTLPKETKSDKKIWDIISILEDIEQTYNDKYLLGLIQSALDIAIDLYRKQKALSVPTKSAKDIEENILNDYAYSVRGNFENIFVQCVGTTINKTINKKEVLVACQKVILTKLKELED